MTETPINPELERIIRQSFAVPFKYAYTDLDRQMRAYGPAMDYIHAHSDLDAPTAHVVAMAAVKFLYTQWENLPL